MHRSKVHTVDWKAYEKPCEGHFDQHLIVNKTETFKDSTYGACTNPVEGLNNGNKHLIKRRNKNITNISNFFHILYIKESINTTFWKRFIQDLTNIVINKFTFITF